MFRALSTAALGMSAQQRSVDNIANNLANVGTTGYKRSTIASSLESRPSSRCHAESHIEVSESNS